MRQSSSMDAAVWKALVICLLVSLLCLSTKGPRSTAADAALDLASFEEDATEGYIRLNDELFSQAMRDIKDGEYSLFIFFDAADHAELERGFVDSLLAEFVSAGKTYQASRQKKKKASQDDDQRIYFCLMDFSDSQKTFERMAIQSLPHVRYVSYEDGEAGVECDLNEARGSAEGFLEFLTQKTGQDFGSVQRPWSLWKLIGIPVTVIGACIVLYGSVRILALSMGLVRMPLLARLACSAGIFIYLFSTSGMMNVIIHNMPFVVIHPGRPPMFIVPGEEQLGVEGLCAGTLYTSAGLALAALINVAPLVKSSNGQRLIAFFCEAVIGLAFYGIMFVSAWKRSGGGQ